MSKDYAVHDYTVNVYVTTPRLRVTEPDGSLKVEHIISEEDMQNKVLYAMRDCDAAEDDDVGMGGVWTEHIAPMTPPGEETKLPYYRIAYQGTMGIVPEDAESEYYKIADAIQEKIPDALVRVEFTPVPEVVAEYGDDV